LIVLGLSHEVVFVKYRATLTIELEIPDDYSGLASQALDGIIDRMQYDYYGNRITRVSYTDLAPVVDPSRSIP
jgi:hypothetical protein